MQRDFHYYGLFVLAHLAQFSREQSSIMAYCSQYVDDSLDHKQIKIGNYVYDTVRTAHTGLHSFHWNVQKKVYFPFHFIPEKPLNGNFFCYITKPNSPFANLLLDDAINDETGLRLYRIGVALHTFADSWSHDHFSGRRHRENNVEKLSRMKNDRYIPVKQFYDHFLDFFRVKIGHVQAYKHPDYTFERWKYRGFQKAKHNRNNADHFLNAAYAIFVKLAHANGFTNYETVWEENKDAIQNCLEANPAIDEKALEKRCKTWVNTFPQIFQADTSDTFLYDKSRWRDTAMAYAHQNDLANFLQTDWVKFQKAALKQRYFVLQRLM